MPVPPDETTSHVPHYIPGNVVKMAASTSEDVVVAISDAKPSSLFVYKYFWKDGQKLQASWSEWKLPGVTTVYDVGFIDSNLYMVVDRANETFIEYMEINAATADPGIDWVIALDRRFNIVPSSVTGRK